jgi:hypothetical protein
MCLWFAEVSPSVGLPNPVLLSIRFSRGVFASSYPK